MRCVNVHEGRGSAFDSSEELFRVLREPFRSVDPSFEELP